MTDKTVVGQDPAQVGVPFEQYAEQVECFALVPVGRIPDIDNGLHHRWVGFTGIKAQTQTMIPCDGQQVIDDCKPLWIKRIGLVENYRLPFDASAKSTFRRAVRRPFIASIGQVVDTADVYQHFELKFRFVAQRPGDLDKVILFELIGQLAAIRFDLRELLAEPCVDPSSQCLVDFTHSSGVYRAIVLVRRILFCNWIRPYTRASAVGGQPGT